MNLYKNGDVEVINLTDGTFYVNKDVDTELAVTENSGSLTRKELQEMVEMLNKNVSQLEEKIQVLEKNDKIHEEKDAELESQIKNVDVLSKMYPVGSVYISTSSTNPSTIFGGVWEAYGSGRTLVGVDTSDTNFNTIEKIGGAATVNLQHSHTVNSHTHSTANHTLTIAEMPNHNHDAYLYTKGESGWGWPYIAPPDNFSISIFNGTNYLDASTVTKAYIIAARHGYTDTKGGGGTHNHGNTGASSPGTSNALSTSVNNLQPYITVYMWKRTS